MVRLTDTYKEQEWKCTDLCLPAWDGEQPHPLQIEIGRYVCFPVEERLCNSGKVEDEEHFCVGCPGLMEARGRPLLKLMKEA